MKIPATVITGFLGAGKTTLIRHLLETARGRRIALIINEFGSVGIDRELLTGCGIAGCAEENIVELANGCICCTVADDFLPTMETLLDRREPPEHIVIETSGLALPKPLVKAFNWPEIRSRLTVDGVVAVIDGPAVRDGRFADDPAAAAAGGSPPPAGHDWPLAEVFADQLQCADLVVLNKADLLEAASHAAVRADLGRRLRPAVKVVSAVHGAVDPRVVLGLGAAVEDHIEARPSCHDGLGGDHDHDDFESFVVALGPVLDPAALEARLKAAAADHDILRVKGFLDVPGKAMRHVIQAVGDRIQRYYDRPWRAGEARRSALVVIGQKGFDRAAVATALSA